MTLVSALIGVNPISPGDMEETIVVISTLTGLQEVEPGWVLCNGAVLPAGARYDPLRAIVGTDHGANGTLPTLIDGVVAVGKGGTLYTTLGATDGAINVALSLGGSTAHIHSYVNMNQDQFVGTNNGYNSLDSIDASQELPNYSFDANGGGGSHNNMPPYLVVEGVLAKL